MSSDNEVSRGAVALVTGAAGIIGPSICHVLQRDGWRVAACDRDETAFETHEKFFGEALAADGKFCARLEAGRDACHALVRDVETRLGPVALLVNNATINPLTPKLSDLTEEFCRMMVEVNLLAPLWLCQAAEASLVAQRGAIINMSSVLVRRMFPGQTLYPITKAALEMLTSVLSAALGPRAVRVNTIRVGSIPGPAFMRQYVEDLSAQDTQKLYAEMMPRQSARSVGLTTIGRAGLPSDIAECVAFLASPRGSFFNGAVLPLDGGMEHKLDDISAFSWDAPKAIADWIAKNVTRGDQ
jgi:NAD(P)-dependent dehydrogenase (short-subunit alcohol dehydrogenase family)